MHRKKILVLGSARPFPFRGNTFQALPPHVALAGARVLWTKSGGGNDLEGGVFIRKAGDRHRARLLFVTSVDREGREGSYFGAMAGAGSTLIFTSADYECVDAGDCTELAAQPGSNSTGTFRVTGTSGSARLAAAPGAIELALSGSRIALLPRSPRSPRHRSLIPARRPSPRPTRRSISAMR